MAGGKTRKDAGGMVGLREGGGAAADGFFSEEGLLTDAGGDFGEFAFVGADSREVIGLADEVEGAKGFPNLLVTGIDGGDFSACRYG